MHGFDLIRDHERKQEQSANLLILGLQCRDHRSNHGRVSKPLTQKIMLKPKTRYFITQLTSVVSLLDLRAIFEHLSFLWTAQITTFATHFHKFC